MSYDFQVIAQAAEHWEQRHKERELNLSKLKAGQIVEAETPERIQMRMERLAEHASKQNTGLIASRAASMAVDNQRPSLLVDTVGLERVLGKKDFLGIDFLEIALAISRFVGRINIRVRPGQTAGFGTGFMVSPRLLLTNNHVLHNEQEALYSEVEFDYQYDRLGRLLPLVVYGLEPQTFFITSKELDFTLVAVRPTSLNGIELKRYGWSRLIGQQGKALLGDALNIIQHPKGEAKQIVLRSNELIDLFDNFAHYITDTEPGSSGSPVYNDQWEVVALHHSGVPKMENGNYIAKDGSTWRQGMDPNDLDWVANEGIRVSSLVDHIKKVNLSTAQERLREELLYTEPPHPLEAAAMAKEDKSTVVPTTSKDGASTTWTIPLQVTVSLGAPALTVGSPVSSRGDQEPVRPPDSNLAGTGAPNVVTVTPMAGDGQLPADEAISIDPDYSNRQGYDPQFLGSGANSIPLPQLSSALKANAAVNQRANGSDRFVLPYHHFSVVMNKKRKLAYFTAVNIDGNISYRIKRDPDKWLLDPRIKTTEQTNGTIYADNPLDRGHLVRRLDPAWGDALEKAKIANDDTFHFTNCSPQHRDFNQNKTTWAGLEDYILDNAMARDLRVSVFTGPVLSDRVQSEYRGINLPREFWKVVLMVKDDGNLSATAYLLSQESLLQGLEEEFSFGAYKTYQVPIRKIEELTGLKFGNLKRFDPTETQESFERETLGVKEITSYEQMLL